MPVGGVTLGTLVPQVGYRECRPTGVSFPVPSETGPQERSVAERDRTIVFATAVLTLLPASLVLAPLIDSPWLHLGATFACCYAAVIGVVLVLRQRFLRRARLSTWKMVDTSRAIPRRSTGPIDAFVALGFAVTNIAVVANDRGTVFTKPLVILASVSGQHVGIVSAHGQQIVTQLSSGQSLVTATTKTAKHDSLIGQMVAGATPTTLVATHETALSLLAARGIGPVSSSDPIGAACHLEVLEQETLRRLHGQGRSPRSSLLLECGAVLTDESIESRNIRIRDTAPVSFQTPL